MACSFFNFLVHVHIGIFDVIFYPLLYCSPVHVRTSIYSMLFLVLCSVVAQFMCTSIYLMLYIVLYPLFYCSPDQDVFAAGG